jgi:DNA invertase Pin-like site-specific DNA recombinase
MDYIYTRVSTEKQKTENQIVALKGLYPNSVIIEETGSGAKERPELTELINKVVEGDRVIVYAIDRLGRSVGDLIRILTALKGKKVPLLSHREGNIDPSTPIGEFTFNIMAALAQMERSILIERTRAGLDRAVASGTVLGRRHSIPEETRIRIKVLRSEGYTLKSIANLTKVSVTRVHEITKEQV